MAWSPIEVGPEDVVVLVDNPRGRLSFKGNELTILAKLYQGKTDPAAARLDSPITAEGGGGGKISYNALREDGGEEELGFTIGRQRESARGDLHNYSGELVTFARDGTIADADDGTIRVVELNANGVAVGESQPPPVTPPATTTDVLVSADGAYRMVLQGDGNLVIRRKDGTLRWDAQSGRWRP